MSSKKEIKGKEDITTICYGHMPYELCELRSKLYKEMEKE